MPNGSSVPLYGHFVVKWSPLQSRHRIFFPSNCCFNPFSGSGSGSAFYMSNRKKLSIIKRGRMTNYSYLITRREFQANVLSNSRRRSIRPWFLILFSSKLGPVFSFCYGVVDKRRLECPLISSSNLSMDIKSSISKKPDRGHTFTLFPCSLVVYSTTTRLP
jgi:hypothetical protein